MEEQNASKDYTSGFNEGYLLAANRPELAEKISKYLNGSDRADGFREGISQYVDKDKDKTKENKSPMRWMDRDWNNIGKDVDKDREREDRDIDR